MNWAVVLSGFAGFLVGGALALRGAVLLLALASLVCLSASFLLLLTGGVSPGVFLAPAVTLQLGFAAVLLAKARRAAGLMSAAPPERD